MKKIIFMFLILTSCNNDDTSNTQDFELVGDWKLIETYLDEGGGGGVFNPIESDKTISFSDDGTVSSNGNMCVMSGDLSNPSSGTYSELDGIITPNDCPNVIPNWNYTFIIEENTLKLYFPCFEACIEKYTKQ